MRRTNTPPSAGRGERGRPPDEASTCPGILRYDGGFSLRMTRSTASPFMRQYVGAQDLPHDAAILPLVDPHEDDGQVARDPVSPEPGGSGRVPRQGARGRPQPRVRIEDAVGDVLEEVRLVGRDAEMMKLDLRLRPRQGGGALERRRIAILVGQGQRRRAGGSQERREHDARTGARREADGPPEG